MLKQRPQLLKRSRTSIFKFAQNLEALIHLTVCRAYMLDRIIGQDIIDPRLNKFGIGHC